MFNLALSDIIIPLVVLIATLAFGIFAFMDMVNEVQYLRERLRDELGWVIRGRERRRSASRRKCSSDRRTDRHGG